LDRINLRSGEKGKDVLLVLESSDPQPIEFELNLPLSAVLQGPGGEIVLAGDEFTIIPIHDFPFVVSGSSFFQVNSLGAEILVDLLLEKLPLREDMLVLDVYCGGGLFSVFLAPKVKKLVGIENHPAAGDDFLYNLAGFDNVEFYDLPAEEVLQNLNLAPDIILLDPPRAGLSVTVLDGLVTLQPDLVAYISCDPATLARDAARMIKGGYQLIESTPFDMFPQTYHIESINIFQRASREV
jgi:23S rRNA (uracil1939-C5)-methyltransferase